MARLASKIGGDVRPTDDVDLALVRLQGREQLPAGFLSRADDHVVDRRGPARSRRCAGRRPTSSTPTYSTPPSIRTALALSVAQMDPPRRLASRAPGLPAVRCNKPDLARGRPRGEAARGRPRDSKRGSMPHSDIQRRGIQRGGTALVHQEFGDVEADAARRR
jgi:hypothetical protein